VKRHRDTRTGGLPAQVWVHPALDRALPVETLDPVDPWDGHPPTDLSAVLDAVGSRQGHASDLGRYVELPEPSGRSFVLMLPWLVAGILCLLEFANASYSGCTTRGGVRYCGETVAGATRAELFVFGVTCLVVAAAYLWRLLFRHPGLVLGILGFENRTGRLRTQRVRWADVADVRVQDRWDWWVHRAWVRTIDGTGWITIRTSGLGLPPSVVEAEIQGLAAARRPVDRRHPRATDVDPAPPASDGP